MSEWWEGVDDHGGPIWFCMIGKSLAWVTQSRISKMWLAAVGRETSKHEAKQVAQAWCEQHGGVEP